MNPIDQNVYAGGQITPEEIEILAGNGIKSIICNRPDGEDEGQPPIETLRAKAEEQGIAFAHIPQIAGGPVLPETLEAMKEAVANMERPMLIYCRSGGRAAKLYELASSA